MTETHRDRRVDVQISEHAAGPAVSPREGSQHRTELVVKALSTGPL